jgi:hypothetical protein
VQRPVWAVHDGNPGGHVIPIPATVWLCGSALGLLGWIRRKSNVIVFGTPTSGTHFGGFLFASQWSATGRFAPVTTSIFQLSE